jgi:hypothetical protein
MMLVATASQAGNPPKANEDWLSVTPAGIVLLDGATARTDTGCRHGVAWFAENLGRAILSSLSDKSVPLRAALRFAIGQVADLHPECDLSNPGSPSAAACIVRFGDPLEYLVLGDVSLIFNGSSGLTVISDQRVSATAAEERREADRYPIGAPQKQEALIRMKVGELAAKNKEGGYWVASSDASGVPHSLVGSRPAAEVTEVAVLTDGAARIVDLFHEKDWPGVLEALNGECPPGELIKRVRELEDSDPLGQRWPRNKKSDDASLVHVRF